MEIEGCVQVEYIMLLVAAACLISSVVGVCGCSNQNIVVALMGEEAQEKIQVKLVQN